MPIQSFTVAAGPRGEDVALPVRATSPPGAKLLAEALSEAITVDQIYRTPP
jgi:hypothetical protein